MDRLLPRLRAGKAIPPTPFLEKHYYIHRPNGLLCAVSVSNVRLTSSQGPKQSLDVEDVLQLPIAQQASFLQAWLFFGMLSEFFAIQVDPYLHLQHYEGHFSSVSLDPDVVSSYFKDSAERITKKSGSERKLYFNKLSIMTDEVSDMAEIFNRLNATQLAPILLSIKLLIGYLKAIIPSLQEAVDQKWSTAKLTVALNPSTLTNYISTMRKRPKDRSTPQPCLPLQPGGQTSLTVQFIIQEFVRRGWCPVRAEQLCQSYDYLTVVYLLGAESLAVVSASHSSCEMHGRCVAFDLTPDIISNYTPDHYTALCRRHLCTNVRISNDEVGNFIESGKIPLLSIDPTVEDLGIKVVPYDGLINFIAISHVWSDKLGNPHKNALPKCQIRRLAKTAAALREEVLATRGRIERLYRRLGRYRRSHRVYLWIDTLFIPIVDGEDNRALQKRRKAKAMQHITPIFQEAQFVLVLDKDLERLEKPSDVIETYKFEELLAANICLSKWLQRAWTLEEGSLARDCRFRIGGDTTASLGELTYKVAKKASKTLQSAQRKRGIRQDISEFKTSPLKLMLAGPLNEARKQATRYNKSKKDVEAFLKGRTSQLVNAWNNLLIRSATREKDPPLIFANMLDFHTALVARLRDEERLPSILMNCDDLPVSLLYNTAIKPDETGDFHEAWLPTRISGDVLSDTLAMHAWKNDSGQRGYKFDSRTSDMVTIFHSQTMIPHSDEAFLVHNVATNSQYVIEIKRPTDQGQPSQYRSAARNFHSNNHGIMLVIDWSTSNPSLNGYSGRGSRLSITSRDKHDIFATFDCPIIAWSLKQWDFRYQGQVGIPEKLHLETLEDDKGIILEQGFFSSFPSLARRNLRTPPKLNPSVRYQVGLAGVVWIVVTIIASKYLPICSLSKCKAGTKDCTDRLNQCDLWRTGLAVLLLALCGPTLQFLYRRWKRLYFNSWLETFDEDWQPGRPRLWRGGLSFSKFQWARQREADEHRLLDIERMES